MKRRVTTLVAMMVGLAWCSVSNASITSVVFTNDADNAISCLAAFDSVDSLSITGKQCWAPGHMMGEIFTDTPADPTLKISNSIENDSTFAWTMYTVNLIMAVPFSVTNVTVTAPGDWGVVSGNNQTAALIGGNYVATVVYDTGTAIPNDSVSTIDFGYWVKFSGATSYTLTQEMIPVPEPSTMVLVAISGLLLGRSAMRRRQRS